MKRVEREALRSTDLTDLLFKTFNARAKGAGKKILPPKVRAAVVQLRFAAIFRVTCNLVSDFTC